MLLALNGISTMPYPFLADIRIGHETGHDGLMVVGPKLQRYLSEGFSTQQAAAALRDLPAIGLGNVRDIERTSREGRRQLLAECEATAHLARAIGCGMVQLLTGPLDPSGTYRDPSTVGLPELRRAAAHNLRAIAEIGRRYGVSYYLEPLAWTPLGPLPRALEVIEEAAEPNIGLALDFWHLWNTGTTPDDIAKLDGTLIRCVDFADSLGPPGAHAGADQAGRRVWTGAGAVPLKEWVDAVRSTGFDGVWSSELLSPQHWELDPWKTAASLREFLLYCFV